MLMASPLLRVLAAPVALAALLLPACPGDDGDDTGASTTGTTGTTGTTTSGATTQATVEPTSEPGTTVEPTSEPGTTVEPTTGPGSSSTTDDTGTSTGTGDDTGISDDTGPICEPGTSNCVCDGGACSDGSVCVAGICVTGLECPGDVALPGDDEDNPVELGDITDDDDDFFQESGVLAGNTDTDWFHWHGADTFGYVAEPSLVLLSGAQRSCLFVVCDQGGAAVTTIECPAGTDFAISPKLRPGCCGAASFAIKDFGCPGQNESVEMWLRLDKPTEDVCSDYEFKVHF